MQKALYTWKQNLTAILSLMVSCPGRGSWLCLLEGSLARTTSSHLCRTHAGYKMLSCTAHIWGHRLWLKAFILEASHSHFPHCGLLFRGKKEHCSWGMVWNHVLSAACIHFQVQERMWCYIKRIHTSTKLISLFSAAVFFSPFLAAQLSRG